MTTHDRHNAREDEGVAALGAVTEMTERTQTAVGLRLRDDFVDRLDGVRRPTRAERMDAALARLAREHPLQHEAVRLTAREGLTLRAAAARLGTCHRTVLTRRDAGLEKLRAWCGNDTDEAVSSTVM